jgi:GT2 family glycosyltransferase
LSTDFERSCRTELEAFLERGDRLVCPSAGTPRVTVVIALWNRAELTLRALTSLCEQPDASLDIVLVDNCSIDDTTRLLAHVAGPTVLTNPTNLGFTLAANQGARAARGELLLFLNSDAILFPGSLASLIRTIDRSPTIGAVGGTLLWPDGRLQEAGGIVWSDGSYETRGRGGDPSDPAYRAERDVDFCSGAVLLTRRDLFLRLGGFDERYQPAYYEDVDYCVRLKEEGLRVVYAPGAVATHVEFASSASATDALKLIRERQAVFVERHRNWLKHQPARGVVRG